MNLLEYIKEKPVNAALAVAFTLSLGLCVFFLVTQRSENRLLKRQLNQVHAESKAFKFSFDSLMVSVAVRDKQDSVRAIKDSTLVSRLTELNNSKIITTNESYTTVRYLPVNDFLKLLTGYIDSAEGKASY